METMIKPNHLHNKHIAHIIGTLRNIGDHPLSKKDCLLRWILKPVVSGTI